MTHKVYVVTDLGPGDGGKGGVVHAVARRMHAHTIIKRGGAQGSHGVCTSEGQRFNFSQWGCGTFEGIPTHISDQMVVSPIGLLNEAAALRYEAGLDDPFSLLSIDETALCATPYHAAASCIKELALRDAPRGTIGSGIGQAYREFRAHPEYGIRVSDLRSPDLRARLAANRERIQAELQFIIEYEFLPDDRATLAHEVALLYDDTFFEWVVEQFELVGRVANIVPNDFMGSVVLKKPGVAVVETSHGVLTDNNYGFKPHTSAIRTLPSFSADVLLGSGFDGQIVQLGVTRAYAIRHGAGPLPTYDQSTAELLLPGSHKDSNRFQGKVRVGALDYVLLRYAVNVCGGPAAFDGLAISWFDQIKTAGIWKVCTEYAHRNTTVKDLPVFDGQGNLRMHQTELTQYINECQPVIDSVSLPRDADTVTMYDICAKLFNEQLGVPVRMVSFGPTEQDKILK